MNGQNGQPNQGNQNNGKHTLTSAIISGLCVIMSSIIGIFSYNLNESNKTLTVENVNLSAQNNDWEVSYNELQKQFNELNDKNTSLSSELNNLKSNLDQYSSIVSENNTLKAEIFELQNELQLLNNNIGKSSIDNQENEISNDLYQATNNTGEKVSIFGLTTFRGYDRWYSRSDKSDSYFTDTYDIEYSNAHLGKHYSCDENNLDREPTYLLDKKYSICTGHIAWSKEYKNYSGSAWIDFYSGTTLIYSSPTITADSRLTEFNFDISDVEKLTIVANGTEAVYVIYSEFDLIKK